MTTYKVVRFYYNAPQGVKRVIKTGLTLQQAQEHCKDPESSWKTCKKATGVARTKAYGPWFDGWTEEKK